MSSFMVCNATLNVIATKVRELYEIRESVRRLFDPIMSLEHTSFVKYLHSGLLELNVEAIFQRYGKKAKKIVAIDKYGYSNHQSSNIYAYKAIRCWLYQCAEGDVPKEPLYKAMEKFSLLLAGEIVENLKEYDEADAWT